MHLNKAREIHNRHAKRLFKETAEAAGVGLGKTDGKFHTIIFVKKQHPSHDAVKRLRLRDDIKQLQAGETIDPDKDLGIEIRESGEIRALMYPFTYIKRMRPAPGGVSVSHYALGGSGTVGCVVYKGTQKYLLSNNHVLALANDAEIGDHILQPGTCCYSGYCDDCGQDPEDLIATLAAFVPIDFAGGWNRVDCAIALPLSGPAWVVGQSYIVGDIRKGSNELFYWCKLAHTSAASNRPNTGIDCYAYWEDCSVADKILDIGLSSTIKEPEIGEKVCKTGRTSGYTEETVIALDGYGEVCYEADEWGYCIKSALFEDQIVTGFMMMGGDSGSAIEDMCSKKIVGLGFAGDGYTSWHNKASNIAVALGITFAPVQRLAGPSYNQLCHRIVAGFKKLCHSCIDCLGYPQVTINDCEYCYTYPVSEWVDEHDYVIGSEVIGTDDHVYRCFVAHHSGGSTRPVDGGSWKTKWRPVTPRFLAVTISGCESCGCRDPYSHPGYWAKGDFNGTYVIELTDDVEVSCSWGLLNLGPKYFDYWEGVGCEGEPDYEGSFGDFYLSVRMLGTDKGFYVEIFYPTFEDPWKAWSFYGTCETTEDCVTGIATNTLSCPGNFYGDGTATVSPLFGSGGVVGLKSLDTEPPDEKLMFCLDFKNGRKGRLCPYVGMSVPVSFCRNICHCKLEMKDNAGKVIDTSNIEKTSLKMTAPKAGGGCCGKAANIAKGYARWASDKAGITQISEQAIERLEICHSDKCGQLTWMTPIEYGKWLAVKGIDIAKNFKDLAKLPPLEKQEKSEDRTLALCRLCKCALEAKIRVGDEHCLLRNWPVNGP